MKEPENMNNTRPCPKAAPEETYLSDIKTELQKTWPQNRTVNVVCHGHSVPAGYFATPVVDGLHSYPGLLRKYLEERYPYAVINVIVTAIGGETSDLGLKRFERDVLSVRPDCVTLDYGLNDRRIGLPAAEKAWRGMIEAALARGIRVILMTPSWDDTAYTEKPEWEQLKAHADQIRRLAAEYGVGLSDSFVAFEKRVAGGTPLSELLSQSNHPNRAGHELIAGELTRYF